MEFKFRAGDDRPTPNPPASSSSTMSFISEQALRANYSSDPNFIRSQIEMYTIQREIEKEKIRLEIIAAENVRRRLLEEEVRRELMMERETAARGSSETGLSTEESHTTQLDSRFPFTHKLDNRLLEDRLAFPESRSLGFGPFGLDMLPPILPQLSDAVTDDNKSALEVNKKGKLIILAKPDPNLCGVKRKAETPPAAPGELPFTNMKKKAKEEWSCALCEVSATSERGLNEHLQGRKHKSKEARLRAQVQKMRNNSTSSHSKESGKQTKVTVGGNIEQKMKAEEESGQLIKAEDGSDQKMDGVGLKNKDEKLPNNQVKKNENVVKKNQNAKNRKKKFKFWCAVCQIGAHSAIVMESHKKGRKHLARLKEQKLNVEAAPTITTTNMTIQASPNCTAKGKDVDAVAKEANEKTTENDALVEGAIEKTENDAMVEEINVAVVEEINGETVENDAIVEEKASEKDEMTKESSEEIAGNDAMFEEANEKTEEDDVVFEDANEKTAEDDVVAEEANKEVAENDVTAEEANKETTNDVVVAEEANKEAAENVAGVTDY